MWPDWPVAMAKKQARSRGLLHRAAGWLWLSGWVAVLYLVAAPWEDLGGLVSERLRWLESFVLAAAPVIGFTAGRFGRDALRPEAGRTYVWLVRWLLYPPALLACASLVLLAITDRDDLIGILLTALLGYWAGLDTALGALPLMEGESPVRVSEVAGRRPPSSDLDA